MKGYEGVRDQLRANGRLYDFLDSAQLVKHAFALRTAVHNRRSGHDGLTPILFYLYAEPTVWPKDGRLVDESDKARHRKEIPRFARDVEDSGLSNFPLAISLPAAAVKDPFDFPARNAGKPPVSHFRRFPDN